MRPLGYQLVPVAAGPWMTSVYGSGSYGTHNYGDSGEPNTQRRYIAMFDGGYPAYPAVRMRSGDQNPTLNVILIGLDGSLLDLTGATSATLLLTPADGQKTGVALTSTTFDLTNRRITFSLVTPQLFSVGTWHARVTVTYPTNRGVTATAVEPVTFVIADSPARVP
jgi:hypothetical protein